MTEQTLDIMGLEEVEIENASIDEIESENINLIFIGIDQSSSMIDYIGDMKKSLKEFKKH
jgi:predicted secreted protein